MPVLRRHRSLETANYVRYRTHGGIVLRVSLLDTWIEFSDSSSCQPVAQFSAS